MSRAEAKAASAHRVVVAAAEVFGRYGYAGTTMPQIAAAAGVSVGTVARVGSKDALYLRVWEEATAVAAVARLDAAKRAPGSLTAKVWCYIGSLIETAVAMPDGLRDYFVAYLREQDHADNQARLIDIVGAIRSLFPPEDRPDGRSPATLAAWTIWLSFTAVSFGLASNAISPDDAWRLMRAVVEAQCAPFQLPIGLSNPQVGRE